MLARAQEQLGGHLDFIVLVWPSLLSFAWGLYGSVGSIDLEFYSIDLLSVGYTDGDCIFKAICGDLHSR